MAVNPIQAYDPAGIEALSNNRLPIPGQSLTASPEETRPFEGQPEFTNFREALDATVAELLKEETYMPLMKAINSGMPLTDIAMNILYSGFTEGKWNPDLLMMLVEPLIFVLMSLAEKAGIEYRLTGDEEDDLDEEEEAAIEQSRSKNLRSVINKKINKVSSVPEGAVPSNIMQKIQAKEVPESLLGRTSDPQEETLLGRTE
tara:strand:+ start:576 stop:1181 length:606 start_codon:yes stop_codon:yes gene_type:complete